ncbi:hypothetical protein GCM10009665_80710 [Kitasatospora nipponensis]|uniref:Uncharacterized protein n=1 Tax=Kitasatospora nipponensis TaxID=258049 RepID=A0ABP4E5G0_9ACTN
MAGRAICDDVAYDGDTQADGERHDHGSAYNAYRVTHDCSPLFRNQLLCK